MIKRKLSNSSCILIEAQVLAQKIIKNSINIGYMRKYYIRILS